MASGDTLIEFSPQNNLPPDWLFVAFTSGSTEPSLGDVIFGDTSNAEGTLEYLALESGAWSGTAAGYMLLSNWNGTAWTSGENFTANSTTPANHGTLTVTPVANFATPGFLDNGTPFLAFDDGVNEVALFQGVMPSNYAGGGVTLTLRLMGATDTLDMSFKAFLKSITEGVDNLLTKNFAAPQVNAAIDAPTTVGLHTDDDITFTDGAQMDSIAAGELFYLLIMRDGQDSTADNMTGDGQLLQAILTET